MCEVHTVGFRQWPFTQAHARRRRQCRRDEVNDMSATLQPRMTVAQAARMMNVPERTVYLAGELMRTGRSDLVARVEVGGLKLLDALRIAKPEKYGNRRDRLREMKNTWRLALPEERDAFIEWLKSSL